MSDVDDASVEECATRGLTPEEVAKMWIVSHELVYVKLSCAKSHDQEDCVLKGENWRCGNRGCRSVNSVLGPFLGGNQKVRPTHVVGIVYGWVSGMTRLIIAKELGVCVKTVTKYTKILEEMCAYGARTRSAASGGPRAPEG